MRSAKFEVRIISHFAPRTLRLLTCPIISLQVRESFPVQIYSSALIRTLIYGFRFFDSVIIISVIDQD
jgi:hypothetical protein